MEIQIEAYKSKLKLYENETSHDKYNNSKKSSNKNESSLVEANKELENSLKQLNEEYTDLTNQYKLLLKEVFFFLN